MIRKLLYIVLITGSVVLADSVLLPRFRSGELSPLMGGRSDLEQYYSGARTVENMVVKAQGGLQKRPGTYYIVTSVGARDEALGDYPTLRATTDQADLGLTKTTAITNVTQLQAMENDLAGNYYLTGDIDASATSGWNGGAGFDPIDTFTGTFDGNGYTITGLFVDRLTQKNALFGRIDGPALIANVTIADCNITGGNNAGALIGEVRTSVGNNATIQNCHSTGFVNKRAGTIDSQYGGLIGTIAINSADGTCFVYDSSSNCEVSGLLGTQSRDMGGLIGSSRRATISNCFATGNIIESQLAGAGRGDRHGGLMGQAGVDTVVTYCYAAGNVTCKLEAGGLIGHVIDGATVSKSYATGNVTGIDQEIGGLIGDNSGDIEDCYAWGNVAGTGGSSLDIGGFVGVGTSATATYKQCYSIGAATGDSFVGGFAGSGNGVGIDIYWDTEASGNATSDGDLEEVGHTTIWLKTNPNYPSTWNFDAIWYQEYISPIDVVGEPARVIPFSYGAEQSYVIEMGHTYMNFFKEK